MISYPPAKEQVAQEISAYAREDKGLRETMELYSRVYNLHREYAGFLAENFLPETPDGSSISKGLPVLERLVLPAQLLQSMLALVMGVAKKFGKENKGPSLSSEQGDAIMTLCAGDDARDFLSRPGNLTEQKIKNLLAGHGLAGGDDATLEMMAFIIRMAVKPFYVLYAVKAAKMYDLKLWQQGRCPVCGQKPMLAMLRKDDGGRLLECGLCHIRWQYYRVACPDCGNKDQEALAFFFVPEQQHRRVYVCNKCKYYVKTTVLKELGRDIIPDLENVATFHLDYLAHKEGYSLEGNTKETH